MKVLYGLVFIVGVNSAFQPPETQTFTLEALDEQSPLHPIGLNDFTTLKERFGKISRKPLSSLPSGPLDTKKIPRTLSDGSMAKIDCKTLDLQINFACRKAQEILEPLEGAHSAIAQAVNFESYQQAQKCYRNALSSLIISFNLKCYDAFEKINAVLEPFIELEYKKKSIRTDYPLDKNTQELYLALEDILKEERKRRRQRDPQNRISTHISKDLTEIRQDKARKSQENGRAFRNGVRNTRKSITNPSLEHYDFIELLTFNAFEHFIMAFNCDLDEALAEAQETLNDLKTIHDWKLQNHKVIGTRYPEALEKFNHLAKDAVELRLLDEATDRSAPGKSSLHDSEKAVHELADSNPSITILNAPLAPKKTPLSLLKAAAKNTKSGGKWAWNNGKKLWQKLPF